MVKYILLKQQPMGISGGVFFGSMDGLVRAIGKKIA
jgi:hypothetical protein